MFTKAQRTQARLRLALCGPSGSGKTYSALLIAQGLAQSGVVGLAQSGAHGPAPGGVEGLAPSGVEGRIAMIDTERGSGTLYSHLTDYDVAPLAPPFTPDRYIDLIRQAGESGYQVLIIDSLSHAWAGEGGILEMHDRATQASRSGNSFAAWREVTPRHNALVDALIGADLHVIVTMRTKTAYDVTDDGNGKKRPIKVGLAPVQRDGLEYEFTVVMDLSIEGHVATAAKDRTGLFDGSHWVPGPATGAALRDWLSAGVDSADASRQQLEKLKAHVGSIDNVPHLNSWWRANAGVIEQLLPPHVDALKAACAERRVAILDALRAKQEEITSSPRRRGPSASAATAH